MRLGSRPASRAFFESPPEGFSSYPLLTPRGALTIARAERSSGAGRLIAGVSQTGGVFREIGEAEARSFVPILERRRGVARDPPGATSADIDVDALHQGYLRLGRARGVEVRLIARLTHLERVGGTWRAEFQDGETIETPAVINAAGAWADQVAALAGAAPLGLTPKRRTVILLDPPAGAEIAAWPTVLDVAEQFYFKPQAGLILASPGDETPSPAVDAAPEELDIAICVDRIQQAVDLPVRHVWPRSWAGLRTFAAITSSLRARSGGFRLRLVRRRGRLWHADSAGGGAPRRGHWPSARGSRSISPTPA